MLKKPFEMTLLFLVIKINPVLEETLRMQIDMLDRS